LLIIRLKMCF